jgi:hypothetical protein
MLLNTILTKIDSYVAKHPWKSGSKAIITNAQEEQVDVPTYLASLDPVRGVQVLFHLVPEAFPRELQHASERVVKMNIHGQWRVDPPEVVTVSKKKQRNEHLDSLMDQM